MTVGWQNRSPLPGGREKEPAATGQKTVAQRRAQNARPESGSGVGGTVHVGGVTANAGEGLTRRRPGAGCASSLRTPLYPRGVRAPLAHVQDSSRMFIPGQT